MTAVCTLAGFSVEFGIGMFYSVLSLSCFLPWIYGQENVESFGTLLKQVFFPSSTISFPEVLLADALTSLSKVFKDFGVTCVVIYAQLTGTPILSTHDAGMLLVAILASLPYW